MTAPAGTCVLPDLTVEDLPAGLSVSALTGVGGTTRTGRWLVVTDGARYLLDLDARTVARFPSVEVTQPDDTTSFDARPGALTVLRGDGAAVPLLELVCCARGLRMEMLVDLAAAGRRDAGRVTRRTSVVRFIHPAD